MGKVLFITIMDIGGNVGGSICAKRNFDSLCHIFGSKNVTLKYLHRMDRKTVWNRILFLMHKFFYLTEYQKFTVEYNIIKNYEYIFVDSSLLGYISFDLKKNGYTGKIITFFHNCEYQYFDQMSVDYNFITKYITLRLVKKNETYSLKYSDKCVSLNVRDSENIFKLYDMKISDIIPISLIDRLPAKIENILPRLNTKPIYTFIGSYFYANIKGIRWFIEEVYPFVSITLRIVGKNMSKLKNEIPNSDIEIYSDVDDLTPFILASDYMLFPIFDGSGMKIKTCESLMYGKNIIGTAEAFEGYELNTKKVGSSCNSANEFIQTINTISMDIFNEYSREMYLEKYSYSVTLNQFKKLFIF